MRRALLVALAVPALVHAQTTAGTITFVPDAFIGAFECNPDNGQRIDVRWTVSATSVAGGTYRVFASTRAPKADTGSSVTLCDTSDVPVDGVKAAQVGRDIPATQSTQADDILASEFVAATGYTCSETLNRTIYVCVHFFPLSGSNATASATGQLTLDLKAPAKPINVRVTPGEKALRVSWDEGTGGQADTSYYRIHAQSQDPRDTSVHESGKTTGTSGRIEKLQEGVEYTVTVTAYSTADNPSEASDGVPGTPVPVEDFFEYYGASGGREQGGCASGPAGALGILGAALALALHRRRK